MKTLDKFEMQERNKVQRVLTEELILTAVDHPFLPTLYCTIQVCVWGGKGVPALQAAGGRWWRVWWHERRGAGGQQWGSPASSRALPLHAGLPTCTLPLSATAPSAAPGRCPCTRACCPPAPSGHRCWPPKR